jgi:glycosyltransferase involved in cell wall biosynthesis
MVMVTVILPVYNAMPYLPEAVESILGQTLKDFRFIIINDGSTDASPEYLDSIKDSRVTIIHQENQGVGAATNRILEICGTEYCAKMDADDISLPRRLETQLQLMQDDKDLVLSSTQVAFISGKRLFQGPREPLRNEMIRKSLMKGNAAICHGASIFRTAAARKLGGYRIRGAGLDTDFFFKNV